MFLFSIFFHIRIYRNVFLHQLTADILKPKFGESARETEYLPIAKCYLFLEYVFLFLIWPLMTLSPIFPAVISVVCIYFSGKTVEKPKEKEVDEVIEDKKIVNNEVTNKDGNLDASKIETPTGTEAPKEKR